jgi:hypothetical protein
MLFGERHLEFGIRERGFGAHPIRWVPRNADIGMHAKMKRAIAPAQPQSARAKSGSIYSCVEEDVAKS